MPSRLLAKRYLGFKNKNSNISFMIRICFAGIAIGSFALMLTLIIMNGFEKVVHDKMQGITPGALITAPGSRLDSKALKNYLMQKFPDKIAAMSGNSMRQVLIKGNKENDMLFIKGVEPTTEHLVSSITDKIVLPIQQSSRSLVPLLNRNKILIGHKTAQQHNLAIGDTITLLIPEPTHKKRIILNKEYAIIGGIFNVGLQEYDSNFALMSLSFLQQLFGDKKGIDQLALTFHKPHENLFSYFQELLQTFWPLAIDPMQVTIRSLQPHLPGMIIKSWKDMYPAIVASLKLEKYVMFFILALIVLVASMNMISLLFMQIQQKRRDVAILRTMGMANKYIERIFLHVAMRIILFASLFGLGAAACAGWVLENYPFIELPDVYYVSHLPARMQPSLFIIVFVCTLLLGFFATLIPARKIRKMNITQILRQE